jgi:DNA polymerase I-like protein with 3'-5' exonuclease and polymerase domains
MPFVSPTLELVGDVAKQSGYIRTICGSHARLPNPNKSYTMLNRFTQGSGAEIMKSSIVRAYKEGVWEEVNPCDTVHDELIGSIAPLEDKIRKVYELARIMTTTVPTKVPMEAEPEFGMNWAETKTIPEWLSLKGTSEWDKLPDILKETILIADRIRGEYEL